MKAEIIVTLDDGTELRAEAPLEQTGLKTAFDEPGDKQFVEVLIVAVGGKKYAANPRQLAFEPAAKPQWNENLFLQATDKTIWGGGALGTRIALKMENIGCPLILNVVSNLTIMDLAVKVDRMTNKPGLGPKSRDRIMDTLSKLNLHFGMDVANAREELNRRIKAGEA